MTMSSVERVLQSEKDSCQNACVAMLTGRDESEIIEEYGSPLSTSASYDLLREEYEFVRRFRVDAQGVIALAYVVESMMVIVESPLRERDPELYEEILEAEREMLREYAREEYGDDLTEDKLEWYEGRAEVCHALVVHRGQVYDPRDPPYWQSLGAMSGDDGYDHDYEVQSAIVCTDDAVFDDDASLPRTPGGVDNE